MPYFVEQLGGNRLLLAAEVNSIEERRGLADGHVRHFGDSLACHQDIARLLPEPLTLAGEACGVSTVAADKDADMHLVLLLFKIIEESADSGKASLSPGKPVLVKIRKVRPRHIDRDVGSVEISKKGAAILSSTE